jgi:hypothetical protein
MPVTGATRRKEGRAEERRRDAMKGTESTKERTR